MRKFLLFLLLMLVFSCKDYIEKPDRLIEKSKMSEVIADFSMNNQLGMTTPGKDMEMGTRFLLKKHEITGEDFTESYKYYTVTKDLDGILEEAKEILLEKHPEAASYIEKKKNDTIPLQTNTLNAYKKLEANPLKTPLRRDSLRKSMLKDSLMLKRDSLEKNREKLSQNRKIVEERTQKIQERK